MNEDIKYLSQPEAFLEIQTYYLGEDSPLPQSEIAKLSHIADSHLFLRTLLTSIQ